MAKAKNKAVFVVLKYPYNHPSEEGTVPGGSQVDLAHLSIEQRAALVDRRLMEPTAPDALEIPGPENKPEPPKLNKYGLPFGQVPAGKAPGKQE